MMTRTEHLLVLLMEECDETSQRASKALRFGLDEVQDGQPLNNAERICYEFNDILAIVELLKEDGLLTNTIDPLAIALKKEKVEKWLAYSVECETVNSDTRYQPLLQYNSKMHAALLAISMRGGEMGRIATKALEV